MVLLEARQAGIVPVAFDCSAGVRDVITHQRNGLLVPAFDEEAFAESLLKLIGDENLRNRLSQQAIEDTRQNDMERIGPLWTALFEELLSQDNILESNNATTELEVLISTYAKPLQPIVDRLPDPMKGVHYLISCQGVQDPEPLDFQRKDVSISFTGSTGIAANRNNSIKAARGKIVWLLDDDVLFAQSDLQRILECYEADPGIDLACFQIRTPEGRPYKHYKEQAFRMKSLDDVRDVSSIEITFRLASIRAKGLVFDERFGLGRQWPCSEEFLFLAACLKAGLHIHYFPYPVVEHPYESTIKKMSQYSPVLLEKSGAVNAVLYGRKAYLRNLVSLIKARKAIKNENMSACDFLRIKNRGSRKLLHSNRDERS
jgi:glycosyltransferase involved in cell wall biosynthesis